MRYRWSPSHTTIADAAAIGKCTRKLHLPFCCRIRNSSSCYTIQHHRKPFKDCPLHLSLFRCFSPTQRMERACFGQGYAKFSKTFPIEVLNLEFYKQRENSLAQAVRWACRHI